MINSLKYIYIYIVDVLTLLDGLNVLSNFVGRLWTEKVEK